MAESFGMQVRFTTKPGLGDAFSALLLEAAAGLADISECLLYAVSRDPDDGDVLWVNEVWTDQDAHTASLQDARARATIERALPLLAGPPEAIHLLPLGGKGLPLP
jgi:quinol monooxygenase YgiN